ncbi:hypothetical protein [Variovorax sp. RCC_210]|jgi:hypothetical protein|uniref:hypothetical protein n=1 Tax=Variovorax sp. RCC_210 TaxID=3239217 RepID=UPI0035236336
MLLQIIYTETAMFLSKKTYPSWRDIQDEFFDYNASLGPWEADVVTEYLQNGYPDLAPSAAAQIAELLASDCALLRLTFLADQGPKSAIRGHSPHTGEARRSGGRTRRP